jgi:hypothetical protein
MAPHAVQPEREARLSAKQMRRDQHIHFCSVEAGMWSGLMCCRSQYNFRPDVSVIAASAFAFAHCNEYSAP